MGEHCVVSGEKGAKVLKLQKIRPILIAGYSLVHLALVKLLVRRTHESVVQLSLAELRMRHR